MIKTPKFSAKRAKAVALGKVNYTILDGNEVVFFTNNFFLAVQQCDLLQKNNPEKDYKMTITEVK